MSKQVVVTRRRSVFRGIVVIAFVGCLGVGARIAHAADPRLDEALASLEKAAAQLLASQSGSGSPKIDDKFQHHVDRALEFIGRAMEEIQQAKDAVDNP
jgi:hypothetical protein